MTTTKKDLDSDFDLVDEDDFKEEFEHLEFKTRDCNDFEIVTGSEEKEPERGIMERIQSISGPQKVFKNTLNMVYNHVLDADPLHLCNPVALFGVVAQATFAASVQQIRGDPEEVDYKEQIAIARKHWEEGKSSWSDDQSRVVQSWLDEAETRLKSYLAQEKTGEKKEKPVTNSQENTRPSSPDLIEYNYYRKYQSYQPHQQTQPVQAKITLRSIIEGNKSANPKMELLASKDPRLYSVLTALSEFATIPYKVQNVEREEVQKNIEENPAMGSSIFIDNLTNRAFMLAQSLKNPELKRVLIAMSGPGTAKSTGCKLMYQWAKFPCCMLSGEVFRNMCSSSKKIPFEIFSNWICMQILGARLGKEAVTGVGILLDDWHFALEPGGPFDSEREPICREKFLLFVKNCGDATQKSVLHIELAPDRKFPLNFTNVHLSMTFNRIPGDFYERADAALRSRYFNLNASYATEEDRYKMATDIYIPQIKKSIASHMGREVTDIIFDEEFTKNQITKVVEVDVCLYKEKFKGQNGIRGLTDLMQMYKQHVLSQLPEVNDPISPKCFDLGSFDPKMAAQSIEDYRKNIDSETSRHETNSVMVDKINKLRQDVQLLSQNFTKSGNLCPNPQIIDELLAKIDHIESARSTGSLNCTRTQVNLYLNRSPLIIARTIGERLRQYFGHLQSGTENSGDIDRFSPLERVVKNMYLRMASSRQGKYLPNEPIFANHTNLTSMDTSVFQTIANIMGNLPVLYVNQNNMFQSELNVGTFIIAADHSGRKSVTKSDYQFYGFTESGIRSVYTLKTDLRWGEHLFIYCERSDEVRILTQKGFDAVVTAGHAGEVTYCQDHFVSFKTHDRNDIKIDWKDQFIQKCRVNVKIDQFIAENVLKQTESKPSIDEMIVVINFEQKAGIRTLGWANGQPNLSCSPISSLISEMRSRLNKPEIKLPDGRTFDPRGITVFFSYMYPVYVTDLPEGILCWDLGTPPIKGRAVHATQYLETQMSKVRGQISDAQKLLGGQSMSENEIILNQDEMSVFEALVKYDQEIAQYAREKEMLHSLPITIIDKNIDFIVHRVYSRMADVFSMGVSSVNINTYKAEWIECYEPYMLRIKESLEKQEKEKKMVEEDENRKRVEQQRADELAQAKHVELLASITKTVAPVAQPAVVTTV